MKKLQDILHESILDDEKDLMNNSDHSVAVYSIFKELTETYGKICKLEPFGPYSLRGDMPLQIDNIILDKKNRLKFVNIPKNYRVYIDLSSVGTLDCMKQYGIVCLEAPLVIKGYQKGGGYYKLSSLNIYEVNEIVLKNCRLEIDRFPKIHNEIFFYSCDLYPFKKPSSLPKGCTMKFNDETCVILAGKWLERFCNNTDCQYDMRGNRIFNL